METATELPASTIAAMIARFRKEPPASPAARAPPPKFWWLDESRDPHEATPSAATTAQPNEAIDVNPEQSEEEVIDDVSVASHASDISNAPSAPTAAPQSPTRPLASAPNSALFTPSRQPHASTESLDVSLTASRINELFPPLKLHNASSSSSSSESHRSIKSSRSSDSHVSDTHRSTKSSRSSDSHVSNTHLHSTSILDEPSTSECRQRSVSTSSSSSSSSSSSNTRSSHSDITEHLRAPPSISTALIDEDLEERTAALLKRCQLLLQQPLSTSYTHVESPWVSADLSDKAEIISGSPPRLIPNDTRAASPESSAYLTARALDEHRNDTSLSSHYNTDEDELVTSPAAPEPPMPIEPSQRQCDSPELLQPSSSLETPSAQMKSADSEALFMYISVSSDASEVRQSCASHVEVVETPVEVEPIIPSAQTSVTDTEHTPPDEIDSPLSAAAIAPSIVPVSLADQFNHRTPLVHGEVAPYLQDEVIAVMWKRLQHLHAMAAKKLPHKRSNTLI